jgi:hypothetical protein
MIRGALVLTFGLVFALALWVMDQTSFLIPYRRLLWETHSRSVVLFVGALFVNVFTAAYIVSRKLFLNDTGRKLAHLEKQLHTDAGLLRELAERLKD